MKFYGLVEKLRESLHKKVDLLDLKQLSNNQELLNKVLRDVIKVYRKNKDMNKEYAKSLELSKKFDNPL